jgi:hypothetical protein
MVVSGIIWPSKKGIDCSCNSFLYSDAVQVDIDVSDQHAASSFHPENGSITLLRNGDVNLQHHSTRRQDLSGLG